MVMTSRYWILWLEIKWKWQGIKRINFQVRRYTNRFLCCIVLYFFSCFHSCHSIRDYLHELCGRSIHSIWVRNDIGSCQEERSHILCQGIPINTSKQLSKSFDWTTSTRVWIETGSSSPWMGYLICRVWLLYIIIYSLESFGSQRCKHFTCLFTLSMFELFIDAWEDTRICLSGHSSFTTLYNFVIWLNELLFSCRSKSFDSKLVLCFRGFQNMNPKEEQNLNP